MVSGKVKRLRPSRTGDYSTDGSLEGNSNQQHTTLGKFKDIGEEFREENAKFRENTEMGGLD